MATISSVVERIVADSPSLDYPIRSGIVSYVKFARHIKPQVEKEAGREVNIGAIVMALQRMSLKRKKAEFIPPFKISDVSTRTGLCEISIAKTAGIKEVISELYRAIELERGETINLIHGNNETTVIFSSSKLGQVKKALKNEKIIGEVTGLSQLSIKFDEDMLLSPGFVSHILKELAWKKINVVEVVSTFTELALIVKDEDLMNTYKAVRELFQL